MTSICGGLFGSIIVLRCQFWKVEALGGQTLSSVIKKKYTCSHLKIYSN